MQKTYACKKHTHEKAYACKNIWMQKRTHEKAYVCKNIRTKKRMHAKMHAHAHPHQPIRLSAAWGTSTPPSDNVNGNDIDTHIDKAKDKKQRRRVEAKDGPPGAPGSSGCAPPPVTHGQATHISTPSK